LIPLSHACLFLRLPLGGEEPVEVGAAGIAGRVLRGEDIGEDVVALAARFVLTHQLGLEEGGPTSLKSLHPSHVRLDGQARQVKGHVRRSISRSVDRSFSQDGVLPCRLVPPGAL